jgi:hypothetical protein
LWFDSVGWRRAIRRERLVAAQHSSQELISIKKLDHHLDQDKAYYNADRRFRRPAQQVFASPRGHVNWLLDLRAVCVIFPAAAALGILAGIK